MNDCGEAPAIGRVKRRTGSAPRRVAADRGYGETEVDKDLEDLGVRTVAIDEPRSDNHFAPGLPERVVDAGNVLRIVLSVAVYPDDVLESQLESQLVSCLHRAAKPQVVRQSYRLKPETYELLGGGLWPTMRWSWRAAARRG